MELGGLQGSLATACSPDPHWLTIPSASAVTWSLKAPISTWQPPASPWGFLSGGGRRGACRSPSWWPGVTEITHRSQKFVQIRPAGHRPTPVLREEAESQAWQVRGGEQWGGGRGGLPSPSPMRPGWSVLPLGSANSSGRPTCKRQTTGFPEAPAMVARRLSQTLFQAGVVLSPAF